MVKIQKDKSRYFVTIPMDIIRMKSWEKGTSILFSIDRKTGEVIIQKMSK